MNQLERGRWFQLVWLVFLGFPTFALYTRPVFGLEQIFGTLILLAFMGVYFWVFFLAPWLSTDPSHALRLASLVGMIAAYGTLLALWPWIGWNGIGLLIYAGAFAGAQRSIWPGVVAVLVSVALNGWLLFTGGDIHWLTAATIVFFTLVSAVLNNQAYHEALVSRALQRSQEEVVRIAKVAERERIARDLHDLLGHTLSVIVLKSELAAKLADKNPIRAAQEIRDVERIARESLLEVRSAVRGYRSTGLEAEFANVRLACEAAQIKLEVFLTPLELEWAQESTLAFCLRESITNVVRHSKAKRVWVSLEKRADAVTLEVWDDGQGVIVAGNGVQGMRERCAALAGSLGLSVKSGQHGVAVCLPLKPEAQNQSLPLGLEPT